MRNLFIEFRELLAPGVLMVGVVTADIHIAHIMFTTQR